MPITTDPEAVIEFDRLCPSTVCPELTHGEVLSILDRHKRASLWVATTAYQVGTVVIPTLANRNGHRYRLVSYTTTASDQLSGATEPSWSTSRDSRVTDNHVTWAEDGTDYDAVLWDFTVAAHEGWKLKASKTVGRVDFTTQSIGVNAGQLHEHCLAMAAQFQPVFCL